jgi:glyoxylase-like metal-dependent hydrolase (beta-lactamase superfamily II)
MNKITRNFLLASLMFSCFSFAADYGKVSSQKVAEGVYLFATSPYGVGLSGNSVAIIGSEAVLIFDTNGLPKTAQTILDKVKTLTDKPVRYVVNSHWHWDHWAGNQVYQAAFPHVKIITHEKTLQLMKEVEPKWNEEGLKSGLPGYLKSLEEKLATMKAEKKSESEIKELQELIDAGKNFLAQKTSLHKTYPNVTFSKSMNISLGNRNVQILHARAITAGDTYVYLPKEKILVTGDIVLSPYPYAIGGTYPAEWLKTLKGFAELKPTIIIPGHGNPQTVEFIQQNIHLFETILQEVKVVKSKGLTLDQTKEAIGKQNNELASIIGITDENMAAEFRVYFLDIFVSRAYRELDAPLSDLPDGLK